MDENNKQFSLRKEHFIIKKFHLLTAIAIFVLVFSTLGFSFMILLRRYVQCGESTFKLAEKSEYKTTSTNMIIESYLILNQLTIQYRLPSDIKPFSYELVLLVYFNDTAEPVDFNGTVKIHFKCLKNTDKIIVHAKELEIFNNTVKVQSHVDQIEIKSFSIDFEREFFIIELSNPLKTDLDYTLIIQYKGYIKEDNIGFYRSSYFDNYGKKR
jgi:hypothetical protein